jgi:hypothetical protein
MRRVKTFDAFRDALPDRDRASAEAATQSQRASATSAGSPKEP